MAGDRRRWANDSVLLGQMGESAMNA